MGEQGSVPGLSHSRAHIPVTSRPLLLGLHHILHLLPPKHRAPVCVSVALPWRCACLEGTLVAVSNFPVAFAGAGNHVLDWGKAAGEEGHLGCGDWH